MTRRAKPFGSEYRKGQRVVIADGCGDLNGHTVTLFRTGPRRQWWCELDPEDAHLRPDGMVWVWAEEMRPAGR